MDFTQFRGKMIDITGKDKAKVLAALYNRAKPQGLGFLHYTPEPMTAQEAGAILQKQEYFDYLNGRVMKVRVKEGIEELDERLFDRDNGQGAALAAIQSI